jgi:hypothetical protein
MRFNANHSSFISVLVNKSAAAELLATITNAQLKRNETRKVGWSLALHHRR